LLFPEAIEPSGFSIDCVREVVALVAVNGSGWVAVEEDIIVGWNVKEGFAGLGFTNPAHNLLL